jgi:hypothetical protein
LVAASFAAHHDSESAAAAKRASATEVALAAIAFCRCCAAVAKKSQSKASFEATPAKLMKSATFPAISSQQ